MKRRELLVKLFDKSNNGKTLAQLHSHALKVGFAHESFFATKLNSMYAKYVSLQQARNLFDETPHRTYYLWNSILRSYCKENQWEDTLYLFHNMVSHGITNEEKPDNFTIPIVLKACAKLQALEYGEMIHGFVKKNEKIRVDMFVGSGLIELYSKCGKMDGALKVFKEFSRPDVVLWTSMVTGYENNGHPEEAIRFFSRMVMTERINPDPITLVSLVSACAQLPSFKLGSSIHGFVTRRALDINLSLVNSLLNLYAKTGSVKTAANLFRKMPIKDVISWSSMISCYSQNGAAIEALELFNEMIDLKAEYNYVSLVSALQACAIACNLEEGKRIHELAANEGYDLDVSVSTALIDMYMKCFAPDQAFDIFEKMPKKDVVSWAALLSGYAQNGMSSKSMGIYKNMLWSNTKPDAVATVKILAACSDLGIYQQAVCLHGHLTKNGFTRNIFAAASLIELYSKCGSIDNALKVFELMKEKDTVLWSAMIAGYGIQGQGREALKIFEKMIKNSESIPNAITFLSVLSACSHASLVEEGIEIFNMMVNKYRINPSSEHYGIIVDLFGRRGELEKAFDIVRNIPGQAGPHVWGALLGACRIHHNADLGEIAAKNLFKLDPNHAGYYMLMSNIYAVDEKWENVAELRCVVKQRGIKKVVGESVVEVGSEVHSFVADDKFHPDLLKVYGLLRSLEGKMKEKWYVNEIEFHLHDAEEVL